MTTLFDTANCTVRRLVDKQRPNCPLIDYWFSPYDDTILLAVHIFCTFVLLTILVRDIVERVKTTRKFSGTILLMEEDNGTKKVNGVEKVNWDYYTGTSTTNEAAYAVVNRKKQTSL